MKKAIIFFVCICIVVSGIFLTVHIQGNTTHFLRIHIRANSNSEIDQNVKYCVKNAVVEAMTPCLENVKSFEQAYNVLENNIQYMENIADEVLQENGFDYYSKISLRKENFPTRTYESLTLQSGVYDALIIELGSGTGDNWWCVVFPPLCFATAGENEQVEYKSLFVEWFTIIQNWWRNL